MVEMDFQLLISKVLWNQQLCVTRSEDSPMILVGNLLFHKNNTVFVMAFVQFMDYYNWYKHISAILGIWNKKCKTGADTLHLLVPKVSTDIIFYMNLKIKLLQPHFVILCKVYYTKISPKIPYKMWPYFT